MASDEIREAIERYEREKGFDPSLPRYPISGASHTIQEFVESLASHAGGLTQVQTIPLEVSSQDERQDVLVPVAVTTLRPVYIPDEEIRRGPVRYIGVPDWAGEGLVVTSSGFNPTPRALQRVKFFIIPFLGYHFLSGGYIQFLDKQPRFS